MFKKTLHFDRFILDSILKKLQESQYDTLKKRLGLDEKTLETGLYLAKTSHLDFSFATKGFEFSVKSIPWKIGRSRNALSGKKQILRLILKDAFANPEIKKEIEEICSKVFYGLPFISSIEDGFQVITQWSVVGM